VVNLKNSPIVHSTRNLAIRIRTSSAKSLDYLKSPRTISIPFCFQPLFLMANTPFLPSLVSARIANEWTLFESMWPDIHSCLKKSSTFGAEALSHIHHPITKMMEDILKGE
jgi:hypothetical protein